MSRALVFAPGEGELVEARGSEMFFKATEASTGGALSLMERELPPKAARITPAHVHDRLEVFYVLEGTIDFRLDSDEVSCGPGHCVVVPSGVGHTFWNSSDAVARLLIIHAPALNGYFEALEKLWSRDEAPTMEEERELQARFGMRPATD